MAQLGSWYMIFAKAFSASSYSNECRREIPRLKSDFDFSEQEVSNPISRNCFSGGLHKTNSPFLRLMALMVSVDGALLFSLHEVNIRKTKAKNNNGALCNSVFISD